MNFVTRFRHTKFGDDISYYVADLGTPIQFENATARLYFVVDRAQRVRNGPSLRGEILSEDQAQAKIADFRKDPGWQEMKIPFQ
jgi:hypothetical protein